MSTHAPSLQPASGRPVSLAARERAYSDAARNTARVMKLRKALPLLTLVLGVGFIGSMLLDSRMALTSSSTSDALGVAGASITMENPKLTGFSKSSRPYEILASRAEQSINDPNKVSLSDLDARIETGSSGTARLNAPKGRFDAQKQQLMLDENVTIRSDKGDMADMLDAAVDLEGGNITTSQPVKIRIGETDLSANGMQILKNGDHIIFDGKVRMTMHPRQDQPIAKPPADMLNVLPQQSGTENTPPAAPTTPEGMPQ